MYSEQDLDAAVSAGAISADAAAALRDHVAAQRATSLVDEESFRLLTGFNDIFVAIAIALLLAALAGIGQQWSAGLAAALVAGASWGLAEFFTRRRRMALPSILLLLSFVGGIAGTMIGTMVDVEPDLGERANATIMAGIAAVTATAAWGHWLRFHVPITVAAGASALVVLAIGLILAINPDLGRHIEPFVLAGGIAVFALAMWWDMSDRDRRTRRADVAFWLHLAAAPMIAHPIFRLLGVLDGPIGSLQAGVVIGLYLLFALLSLAIDRRALLISSLAYVLFAMKALFDSVGVVGLNVALTGLVIGSALLLLSAFWHPVRRAVVTKLGHTANRLPPVQAIPAG